MKAAQLTETVREFIVRESLFDPGSKIVAAVSGGADSLCLVSVLRELGYPLCAAHFDHRLRADSGRDVRAAREAAERLGVPFILGRGDVRRHARDHRLSLEEAARVLRYGFLRRAAVEAGASAVAAGHTMDDQAETVLLHLVRGAGLRGLGGIRPSAAFPLAPEDAESGAIRLARPLLCLTHAQTVDYCRQLGWTPVEDPSNRDSKFARNRIRVELLPLLERYNGSIVERLSNLAAVARDQNDGLERVADGIWSSSCREEEPGLVRIPAAVVRSAPPAVQQILARRAVYRAAECAQDLAFRHVNRVLDFVRRPTKSRRMNLALGVTLSLENDWLVFSASQRQTAVPDWEGWTVPIPGDVVIRHPDWGIRASLAEGEAGRSDEPLRDPWTVRIDPQRIRPPLILRRRRASERFLPEGMPGPVKLNDFLASHRLPFRERDRWPLLCDGEGVLWIPGFRLRRNVKPSRESKEWVEIIVNRGKP